MGLLNPVVGGDMEHSFGVFGWAKTDGTTYKASEQSFSRNWNEMCQTAATSAGFCPTATTALTSNAVATVVTVSVWAFDHTKGLDWSDTNSSSLTL